MNEIEKYKIYQNKLMLKKKKKEFFLRCARLAADKAMERRCRQSRML